MSIYIAHYRKNNASNALIHVLKTSKMVEYRLRWVLQMYLMFFILIF